MIQLTHGLIHKNKTKIIFLAFFTAMALFFSLSASAGLMPNCLNAYGSSPNLDICCPMGSTENGVFYLYQSGSRCLPADGINHYNENTWCKNYLFDSEGNERTTLAHYLPQSNCSEASIPSIPDCLPDCVSEYQQCNLNCPLVFLPEDPFNPQSNNQCLDDCSETLSDCRNECGAGSIQNGGCYYSGADYLGWETNEVKAKAAVIGKNPCDLLFPEQDSVNPDGQFFQYFYDYSGSLKKIFDPYKKTEINYYSMGYLPGVPYATTSANSGTETTIVTPTGNVIMKKDAKGNKAYNTYDAFDRLTETTAYCNLDTTENGPSEITEYFYDYDSTGYVCGEYGMISQGKLCETKTFSFDCGAEIKNDSTKRIESSVLNAYDNLGRITKETKKITFGENTETFVFSYTYDFAGNLTSIIYPDNRIIEYSYNILNQLESMTIQNGKNIPPENFVQNPGFENPGQDWSFGPNGRIVNDPINAFSGNYYALVDLYTPQQTIQLSQLQSGQRYRIGFWAKKNNQQDSLIAEMCYKDINENYTGECAVYCHFPHVLTDNWQYFECANSSPIYQPQNVNKLELVFWQGSYWNDQTKTAIPIDNVSLIRIGDNGTTQDSITEFNYNPSGTLSKKQTDNIFTSYEYTSTDYLWSIHVSKNNFDLAFPDSLFERSYKFDKTGNILKIGFQSNQQEPTAKEEYVYDNIGRLTNAAYPASKTQAFSYDLIGNRLTETGNINGNKTYNYNNAINDLLSNINSDEWVFAYDTAGNITSMKKPGTGTINFEYDALNRLTKESFQKEGTSENITQKNYYDSTGKRIMKSDSSGFYYYVYKGNDVVLEKKGCDFKPGDADSSGNIDISDVVFLINRIFSGGPAPNPIQNGDPNSDGSVDISDAVFLIAYIFTGGNTPPSCSVYLANQKIGKENVTEINLTRKQNQISFSIDSSASTQPVSAMELTLNHPAEYSVTPTLPDEISSMGFQLHYKTEINGSTAKTKIGIINIGDPNTLPQNKEILKAVFSSNTKNTAKDVVSVDSDSDINQNLISVDLDNSIATGDKAENTGIVVKETIPAIETPIKTTAMVITR